MKTIPLFLILTLFTVPGLAKDEPIYAVVNDTDWTSSDHYLLKHISEQLDEISKKLDKKDPQEVILT